MLGYSAVKMNMSPKEQPVRTLLPGRMIIDNPDNHGGTGLGGPVDHPKRNTMSSERAIDGAHGDTDLRQSTFTNGMPMFGKDYLKMANMEEGSSVQKDTFQQKWFSPLAQAQKLRNNMHFNLMNLRGSRNIASPDIQSQFETGYTLPLQEFGFISDKIWNSPAGKNAAGSMMSSSHPSLKRVQPKESIPTRMPWNVSAPGSPA